MLTFYLQLSRFTSQILDYLMLPVKVEELSLVETKNSLSNLF